MAVPSQTRGHLQLLSTLPASTRKKRFAAAVLACLLVPLAFAIPYADMPSSGTGILLPAYATAVLLNDLITAALLFAIFAVQPSRALLALSVCYLFAGLSVAPWMLTFPGVFSETGLLGAGLQSTASIAAVRRIAFPLLILVYALSSQAKEADSRMWTISPAMTITASVLLTAAAVAGITAIILAGDAWLPGWMADYRHTTPVWNYVLAVAALLYAATLIMLWRRECTVLDIWLMVALCSSFIEMLLLGVVSSERFSVGWWAGRAYGLTSASVVLLVLLAETTTLYARLWRSLLDQQRARDARLATMEALSASMAYEINQPLASMATNADAGLLWLKRKEPDLDQASAALSRILDDSRRASEIVDSVGCIFRKNARKRVPLDMNRLIKDVLASVQSESRHARVTVRTELDQGIPQIAGNPVQLQQVVLNLVTNAIEAMQSMKPPRALTITSQINGAGLCVTVEDSGPGVDDAHKALIFDPFFTTKDHGMGMGLLISRSIIEGHGGRLWIADSTDAGTTFQFTLPTG